MKAAWSFETSITIYETRRNIQEDLNPQQLGCDNRKSSSDMVP
jgi:hypothetical protein